jgi:hypothetical protein
MRPKEDIARDIVEYLQKHPEASDSLEGITEWWLLHQRIQDEVMRVKEAVLNLIQQGWLIEIRGRDSRIHYHLRSVRKAE